MPEPQAPDWFVPTLNASFLAHVFSELLQLPPFVSEAQSPPEVFLFRALVVELPSPRVAFYVSLPSLLLLFSISLLFLRLLFFVTPRVLPLYVSPQMKATQLLPGQIFCLTR